MQQEIGKLTLEKHQDDRKADRAERDKQRARADWQTAQQRAEDDSQKAQQQAQEDWLEAKQRAQEDLQKAKQRAREALQTAQQRADEDFQLARRRARKDRHEADDNLRIVRERYDELSQVSSEAIEELECEWNQAVIDRDRAIADKEKAMADKEQALADREQAVANLEQAMAEKERATTEASSRTLPATRMVDHARDRMDQLMSLERQRDGLSKAQKRADRDLTGGLDDVSRELEPSKHFDHNPQRKGTVLRTRSVQEGNSADPMINSHHECNKTSQSKSPGSIDERGTGSDSDGLARDGLCMISNGLDKVAQDVRGIETSPGSQASTQAPVNDQAEGDGVRCSSFGATSLLPSSTSCDA